VVFCAVLLLCCAVLCVEGYRRRGKEKGVVAAIKVGHEKRKWISFLFFAAHGDASLLFPPTCDRDREQDSTSASASERQRERAER
jgi:hypothetical protein